MTENIPGSGSGEQTPSYGSQPPSYGSPADQQAPGYGSTAPSYGATPPPAYQQPGSPAPAAGPLNPAQERQYAMLSHLGGILGWIGWVPSLIFYLVFKDRGPFIKDQAREALNFQITAVIGYIVIQVLDSFVPIPLFFLSFFLWVAVVVFSIVAGLAANKGQAYRYPFSLRLVN